MKSIIPLEDRVVIKVSAPEELRANGLVIPNAEAPQYGTVLAVGPGRQEGPTFLEPSVAAGDSVVFSRYGGQTFQTDDDGEVLLVSFRDILAKAVL